MSSGPQGETRVEVRHRDGSFTEVDPEKAPEYQEGVQRFEQLKARNPKQAAMVAARAGVDPDEEPSQPSEAAQEQPEQEPREPEAQESDNEGPEEPETPDETERDTGETKRDDDETRRKRGVLV